ncbi:E3 SUMO-protein ligase ZBED1-like isoform X1 [Corythoichthys intestinalis]|uniref:E3 SUMO-protein ligase ZBED1-like isoform X1 n=1 Tax=Corythoichthys intestinalis TaxID=161448 RepID=UPI0025A56226|nr:E3 SUMO-protein ligase ZBED1-like isoform X1 [Corythoichthys intestinalis]
MDSPSLFVFSSPLLRYLAFDSTSFIFAMEPAGKRRFSPVWEHFELISPQKVKCLVCSKVLSYNNNTSTMLRHYRVLHGNEETNQVEPGSAEKVDLAELLVDMVIEDSQPFSLVDGSGFKKLMKALAPSYVLPTRQTLKAMVEKRYKETKDKTKAIVAKASACSLTSDMWTSINTDAYLAVTCHFIDETTSLQSVVLGVQHFPEAHTAANMAFMKTSLMSEWGISDKVTCLVTDGAANMGACARELHMRHTICVAHMLNLLVKKALDQCPELFHIWANCRKIVGYFKSSTTAKERLTQMQVQMGLPVLKLLQEVETRWNSTYLMLQRIYTLREPVGAALAGLRTDLTPLSAEQYRIIADCLKVLEPFNYATIELSEEKKVSGSKVIPLLSMLHHSLEEEEIRQLQTPESTSMVEFLQRQLREKLNQLQSMSIMFLATLLDPRFKKVGFFSPSKAAEAEKRLTMECAAIMSRTASSTSSSLSSSSSSSSEPSQSVGGSKLWHFDASVHQARTTNVTANATVEVQKYLGAPNIPRVESPLQYWESQKCTLPTLYKLAVSYLCTPASSVPCERVFSKAGEILCKKRNRLSPKTLEKILFLNKNE